MIGTVHSSHGEISIDVSNGRVIETRSDEPLLLNIVRFNVFEYWTVYKSLDSDYDILDLGYWTDDNSYIEPDYEFRELEETHKYVFR